MSGAEQAPIDLERAYELLAHLVSSAEVSLSEPQHYGSFRLIDAASRLVEALLATGLQDPWLRDFGEDIDHKKVWMMTDREAYADFLAGASRAIAARLKERANEGDHG